MKINILIPTIALVAILVVAAFYYLPQTIGVAQCGQYGGYREYSNGPCAKNSNFDWNQDSCEGNCTNNDYWKNAPYGECCQPRRGCGYSDNEFQRYNDISDAPQGYGCPWMYN